MADPQPPPPSSYPSAGPQYSYDASGQYASYYSYPQGGYDAAAYYAYYGTYPPAQAQPGDGTPAPPLPPSDGGHPASADPPPPPPPDAGAAPGLNPLAAQAGPAGPGMPHPPPPGAPGSTHADPASQQAQQPSAPGQQAAGGYYSQPGYPGYAGPAAGDSQQQYDYSQYYAQQQYQQYYSQQQQYGQQYGQSGAYQQQPYAGYAPGAQPPQPPTLPAPSPAQRAQQQQPLPAQAPAQVQPSWSQVAQQGGARFGGAVQRQGGKAGGFSIKAQVPRVKPGAGASPLVDAFNAAAASIGAAPAAGKAGAPAYVRVGAGPPQAAQQGGGGGGGGAVQPQNWPPSLRAWVERLFKTTDSKQRAKLQHVLKSVIQDATSKGELWTRDWDTMPLPDLTQTPQEAAAILAEVAAVSGPAAGAAGTAAAGGRSSWQRASRSKKRVQLSSDSSGYESEASEGVGRELSYAERRRRERRAGRFGDGNAHGAPGGRPVGGNSAEERRQRLLSLLEEGDAEDIDWDSFAIKGTSQSIEKSYFRLTSAPDPSTVRPEPVLARALERLVGLIRGRQVNYLYMLDQFKGMRQDCTVQHIRNQLAARVYEAHARAALEYGDVAEYNQCQSQVAVLYQEGVTGCRTEFLAYRILYQAVHAQHGEILQLLNTLKTVSREDAEQPEVAFALRVRRTLAAQDYAKFFRLYHAAPKLGRAIMDIAVPKLRYAALCALVKAYRPGLSVQFTASLLGFVPGDTAGTAAGAEDAEAGEPLPGCAEVAFQGRYAPQGDAEAGVRGCLEWLGECKAVVTGGGSAEATLDCKASTGQIRVPEDKTAVAHGDANLAIDDFLSKAFEAAQ